MQETRLFFGQYLFKEFIFSMKRFDWDRKDDIPPLTPLALNMYRNN